MTPYCVSTANFVETGNAPDPTGAEVEAILAGDRDALTRWFETEADRLYGFVFHRVGRDSGLAADVVQSTMSKALSQLRSFDPERGTMATWLRVMSRNIIRATVRPQRVEVPIEAFSDRVGGHLHALYTEMDSAAIPGEVLERDETRELVGMAIADLSEDYREVLTLKYIDECALTDIAELRDTTVDAVKSQLRRARSAFRDTFLTLLAAQS